MAATSGHDRSEPLTYPGEFLLEARIHEGCLRKVAAFTHLLQTRGRARGGGGREVGDRSLEGVGRGPELTAVQRTSSDMRLNPHL